jgi:hypothetical protein
MVWVLGRIFNPEKFDYESGYLVGIFIIEALLTILTITVGVAFAEGSLRGLRVPGGRAYRFVGGNRWAASGIEGLIAGGTLGWLTTVAYRATIVEDHDQETLEALIVHAVLTGLGFIIAEGLLHAFRRRPSVT